MHHALHLLAQRGQFIAQLAAFLLGHHTVRLEGGLMACNAALTAVQPVGFTLGDAAGAHALGNAVTDLDLAIVDAGGTGVTGVAGLAHHLAVGNQAFDFSAQGAEVGPQLLALLG